MCIIKTTSSDFHHTHEEHLKRYSIDISTQASINVQMVPNLAKLDALLISGGDEVSVMHHSPTWRFP